MRIHQKSPLHGQFSTRLLSLEFYLVRRGISRYVARAVDLARDIETHGSHSAAVIRKMEQDIIQTLGRLETKVGHVE